MSWANRLQVSFLHQVKLQVPYAAALVGMTTSRAVAHLGICGGGWTESAQQQPTHYIRPLIWSARTQGETTTQVYS
jgi:hypothetical protein